MLPASSPHYPALARIVRVVPGAGGERTPTGSRSATRAPLSPLLMGFESGARAARARGRRGRGDGGIFVLSLSRRQHGARLLCRSDPFFLDLDLLLLPCEIHWGDAEVVTVVRDPYAATAPPPVPEATFYLFYAYIPPRWEKRNRFLLPFLHLSGVILTFPLSFLHFICFLVLSLGGRDDVRRREAAEASFSYLPDVVNVLVSAVRCCLCNATRERFIERRLTIGFTGISLLFLLFFPLTIFIS
ncbi:hypothetical protein B0H14DRAFT_2736409, partial [Mycena olivaceomarginata]